MEWEKFAATLVPGEGFSESILRDDIVDILKAIAGDMDQAESVQPDTVSAVATSSRPMTEIAGRHAQSRLEMGMSSRQLIAEFRALRVTVVRLWHGGTVVFDKTAVYDLTRFNVALDRVLSEATVMYTDALDRSRDTFLGILGHDLRNPLAAITGAAELQLQGATNERHAHFASQILVSAGRISHLITDLIELTRVRLGAGIVIKPALTSMRQICTNAIQEMQAIYPRREFHLVCDQELPGEWDEARLGQVLSNLLGNAVQHGARDTPVTVTARAFGDGVELLVHNTGPAIPEDIQPKLFDRLFQVRADDAADEASSSMGLGLYIARQIVVAHGGTIEVTSSDEAGTCVTARFPSGD